MDKLQPVLPPTQREAVLPRVASEPEAADDNSSERFLVPGYIHLRIADEKRRKKPSEISVCVARTNPFSKMRQEDRDCCVLLLGTVNNTDCSVV